MAQEKCENKMFAAGDNAVTTKSRKLTDLPDALRSRDVAIAANGAASKEVRAVGTEARQGHWIEPGEKDGWLIVGTGRFPGPGWSGEFRGRPATLFDFAAKLHDLNYVLNAIKFGVVSGTIGHGVPFLRGCSKALSRKAKADFIFRKMTEVGRGGGAWVGFINWAARAVFYDDPKYFRKDDGFANALLQPETSRLANPDEYFMIPFSHLKAPRFATVAKSRKRIPNYPKSKVSSFPNYMERSADDINPGWWAWAESVYGKTWRKIQGITDETDSSFKWSR